MQHGPRLVSDEPIKSFISTSLKQHWATFNLSLTEASELRKELRSVTQEVLQVLRVDSYSRNEAVADR